MIEPLIDPASRAEDLRYLFARLGFGQNAAIVGLNDVGKTTLLSLAQLPETARRYGPPAAGGTGARDRLLARVDCNLLAPPSERELYAVMARGLADAAARAGNVGAAGMAEAYLERVRAQAGAPASAVPAALEFEALLVQVVEGADAAVAFLFDEFDAMYRRMDARMALALRAFHNRLGPALAYVAAVDQPLERLRPASEENGADTAEFEELFVGGARTLAPLDPAAAAAFVARYLASRGTPLPPWVASDLAELTGGHPGLLWAACAAVQRLRPAAREHLQRDLPASPEVRAECDNVWRRLPPKERQAVLSLGRDRRRRETARLLDALQERGLIRRGAGDAIAIPLLARYLAQVVDAAVPGLVFDPHTGELEINGGPPAAPLGPTEHRLLQLLYERAGALVTKDEVARAVWPQEERLAGVDDARIDKLVDRVRAKIEPEPRAPRFLLTVRGLGYRLVPHP